VAGLTTAATVRFITGIGMACGPGLPLPAAAATAIYLIYFIVALIFPLLLRGLPAGHPTEQNERPDHD
jgi:putative Mg2+ transporter-C (MgtC) family protein